MTRVAAIDAGSNTVLLLVAEHEAGRRVRVLHDEQAFVRLGEGVDESGRIHDAARERALEAFGHYAEIADEHMVDHVVAAGTSALRDAANGAEIVQQIQNETGIEVEIVSGDREAELSFSAVARSMDVTGTLLVIDIGGNSTELIRGTTHIEHAKSLNIGSVRMTERFLPSDPPTADEGVALDAFLEEALAALADTPAPAAMVAVAGTATTLAALHHELQEYDAGTVDGTELSLDDLSALRNRLAPLPAAARAMIPCLHPKRADVIVAGIHILEAAVKRFGFESVTVVDRGIRHALAFDALGLDAGERIILST